MSEKKGLNFEKADLLRELYSLSEQYEESDQAREILRKKAKKIDTLSWNNTTGYEARLPDSDMQLYSEAIAELVLGGAPCIGNRSALYDLANMRECAEKEFVLALNALKSNRGETQRLEAIRHISRALESVPNDPRYITMALILQQA